ncbi:MAG: hypothetical protein J5902_03490 [Paludibacteraceae bacterium]|nr:hypothetical protein [Paludibacteraceae bacterium]
MKHTFIPILLLVGLSCAYATPLEPQTASPAMTFQSIAPMNTGAAYTSAIYQPFCEASPSECDAEGNPNGPNRVSVKRNGFGPRPDGNIGKTSPVGEPFILLAFAAIMGAILFFKKSSKISEKPNNQQ